MYGRERFQPNPNGPFPDPESYVSKRDGPNPDRPGLVVMGTVRELVPVAGFAANFSPIPRIAPPPFGRDMAGKFDRLVYGLSRSEVVPAVLAPEGPALFLSNAVCVKLHLNTLNK